MRYHNVIDGVILRVDYGIDLEKHHFATAHVHIGRDSDNIACLISEAQQFFPAIYIPEGNIDNNLENDIIQAIRGFVETCGITNIDEIAFENEFEAQRFGRIRC